MLEDLGFTSGAPASSNNSDPAPASAPGLVKRSKGEEGMAKSVAYSPTEIAGGMPQRDAEYEARYAAAPGAREDLIREINRAPNEAARATLEGEFSKVYGEAPPVAGLMRVSTAARAAQPPKVNSKAPKPIEATGESRIEDVGFQPYGDQPKAAAQSTSENGEFAKGAMNALVGGNPRMLGRSMEVFGLLTDSPSVEEKGSALVTKSDEWSEKYKGRVPSAENIGDDPNTGILKDSWDYLKFQAGNALGSMAPSLVAGAAVGVATKSPRVGFVAGAAIPAYVQNLGDVYDSVATDPDIKARIDGGEMTKKQLAGIAAVVAVPVAALDMWSLDKGVSAFFKEQKGALYSRIAKAIATGAITEGSTEGLQQVIQEWAQVSLGSEKSLKSSMFAILDSVIGGMAGGSLVRGGATAVAGVMRPNTDAPPINKPGDASPISVDDVPGVGGGATAAPAAPVTPASGPAINLEGVGAQARDALFNLDQGDTPLDRYNRLGRDLEKLDPDGVDHAQLTADRNDIATSFPTTALGDPAILSMPSGAQLESRYGLIEADDAVSSHRGDMTPEPDFPATWQERNRGAAASQVQIATIKARPDYNLLGQSPSPQEGAPTLAVNGVSLAGRGRLIAEKAIYDEGGEKADIQRQKMIAMAIDAGVPAADAQQFRNPIFSRFLTTPVNPVEFARQADQKSGMVMSPIELARSDANRMGSIDGLQITEGGDFMVPANRAIIKGFFAGLPQSEQAGLVDATGDISQAGYRRFMNAMLVKAYGGNSGTAMRIIETLNPDLKRLTGALVRVAPLIAKARDAVRDSKLAALDISQDLVAAVDQLVQLRDDKMSVTDFLAQSEMFERVNEDTLSILMFLEDNLNSPNRIVQFVEAYLAELELVGNVDQNEMFGAAPMPTRAELLAKSKGDLNDEAAKLATAISAKQGTSDETVAAEPSVAVEAAPAEIPVSVEAGASSEQQPDNGLFGAKGAGAGQSSVAAANAAVGTATEQDVPENLQTLIAQQEALVDGRRDVQMFPNGTDELVLPEGMQRVKTPRGIFHYNPKAIKRDTIIEKSAAGRENELLNLGPLSKRDVLNSGEAPIAVVERDKQGNEVTTAATTPSAQAQTVAAIQGAAAPGNTVTVEQPEKVVSERAAIGAEAKKLATKPKAAAKEDAAPPAFDSEAFDKKRADTVKASRDAGNTHLDKVPAYVETMRGKNIYYVHDTKVKGTIRTVDNRGNVYVNWADEYSAEKEMASEVKDGRNTVMQSSLGPSDLKDYALAEAAPVAKAKAAPAVKAKAAPAPKAKPPVAKKPIAAAVEQPKGFGDTNTVFTKSRADAARALLKKKSGQLNVGLDPEMMQAGIELAGYYIEGGARSFADYSAKMLADLGDEFKPYFKAFYSAVRNWPGFDTTGMQSEVQVEAAMMAEDAKPADKKPKAEKSSGDEIVGEPESFVLPNKTKGWKGMPDADIQLGQLSDGLWVSAAHFNSPTSGFGHSLNRKWGTYETRQSALDHAVGELRHGATAKEGDSQAEQKYKQRLSEWLDQIGGVDLLSGAGTIASEAKKLAKPKKSLLNKEPPGGWTDADKVPKKAPDIVATYPSVEGTEIHVVKNTKGYVVNMMDTDIGEYLPTLRQFTGDDALDKANEYAESIQKKADPLPADADLTFGLKFPDGYTIERNEGGDVVFSGPPDGETIGIVAAGADYSKETAEAWSKIANEPPHKAPSIEDAAKMVMPEFRLAAIKAIDAVNNGTVGGLLHQTVRAALMKMATDGKATTDSMFGRVADLKSAIDPKKLAAFLKRAEGPELGGGKVTVKTASIMWSNDWGSVNLMRRDKFTNWSQIDFSMKMETIIKNGKMMPNDTRQLPADARPSIAAEAAKLAGAKPIDEAAHEAATSPQNDLFATQPQIEAGNYKKGHFRINGLDISIENPEGSERTGVDPSGRPWSVTMQHHYGYIRGTIGRDKDHLDVFVKPGTPEDFGGSVYVVDQRKLGNGHFDEHKIMLGWDSLDDARAAYIENYDSHGPERIMGIKTLTFPEFKAWLNSGETTQPAAKMDEAAEPKTESATTMPAFTTAPSQEDAGASAAAEYKPGGWRVFDDKGTMIAQQSRRDLAEKYMKPGYRLESPEARAANTEDAGAELAYNRRNRIKTGIKWGDIADKNEALRVSETTKQNVYPKPDYEALIAGGVDPMIAHLVKQAYDSLAAKPVTRAAPTDADLKLYIEGVNRYMDGVLAWANDKDALGQWAKGQSRVAGAMAGKVTSLSDLNDKPVKSLVDMAYSGGWREFRHEISIIGGNKAFGKLQPGYDEVTRAIKAGKEGWPSPQEAWQKQGFRVLAPGDYKVQGSPVTRNGVETGEMWWHVIPNVGRGSFSERTAGTDEATEKAVAEGKFVLGHKNKILGRFDTDEAAKQAAREATKRDGGMKISDKGISVEAAERIGEPRRMEGEDVTSDHLRDTFGFKGVNFGTWMKGDSNRAERQLHLNHAYDSFTDLADLLGVPPKAISLNGMLGVAIGAQGGGHYAAHFVPGVNEINLTRTSGAGSLAHEWGHALDHYFAMQAGVQRSREPFLTEHVGGKQSLGELRPEIAAAFKTIVDAMNLRPETPAQVEAKITAAKEKTVRYIDNWLAAIKRDFVRETIDEATFDALAARIRALDLGDGAVTAGNINMSPVVDELRNLYKAKTGRLYSLDQIKGLQSNLDHAVYLNSDKAAERAHVPQQVSTEYAANAASLDKGKQNKYWSTNLEKFARAFDAFVSDKLETIAAKNTYLSHAGRTGETVPSGDERTAINKAFQTLVDTVETRETEHGTAMFKRGNAYGAMPVAAVKQIVANVRLALPDAAQATVLGSTSEAPAGLLAQIDEVDGRATVQGAWWRGKVYLFANNISSREEAEYAILHEYGHDGLRKLLGPDLDAVLTDIWSGSMAVQLEVAKLRKEFPDLSIAKATEEHLANVAASGEQPTYLQKLVAFVRGWLREHGFVSEFSDTDILGVVAAARGALTGKPQPFAPAFHRGVVAAPMFMRGVFDDMTAFNAIVDRFSKSVAGVISGDESSTRPIALSENTPASLRVFGFRDLPVVVRVGSDGIGKMFYDHGMTVADIGRLIPETLKRPAMILQHIGHGNIESLQFIARDEKNGLPIVVAVNPERAGQAAAGPVQLVATAFPLAGGWPLIQKAILRGGLLYRDTTASSPEAVKSAMSMAQKKFAREPRSLLGIMPKRAPFHGQGYRILGQSDLVNFEKKTWGDNPMFKRVGQADELTPAQRADAILSQKRGTIAPLDATFKALSNASGFTKLTTKAYGLFERLGSFVPEKAKAGLISDYGIPEAVIDLREAMFGKIRQGIRGVQHQLERLMGLTRAESSVAYEWMNGRDAEGLISRLPEDSQATLRELRDWIDTMGREAVRLGQLTAAAYEKNRFAYLHRSYLKYETDQGKQASANRGRAISVLGDQYKGRGMVDAVPMSKIRNAVGIEFWNRMLKDGQADKGLVGEKFIRFERRANRGEGVGVLEGVQKTEQRGKLLEVAYWPENLALPSHLAGWERSADLWLARNTKGDKVLMWRDFTAAERRSMGEIDEVRYSVAKTMQQMIHDVEVGRYLEKLANTFAKPEAPRGAEIVEASERMVDSFKPGTWVEVPTSKIVGTQALKYGKLAGLWIEGPVWNDIRQTVNQRYQPFGEAYATVLKAWKIAKAPLSPAVHMNNIAANVVMADWHDVRSAHLLAAMKVMLGQDDPANVRVMERFEDAGGSSGTFAISEIQRTQLKPLLEALEEQIKATDESRSILNASAVLQALLSHGLNPEWRQALAAADSSKGAAAIKSIAGKAVDLYQLEDVAFRLAAFMKAKSEGAADLAAGKVARKSFLDYSINAPWIQAMRATAFPFFAFTYRAVPMLIDIAAHKPWKLLKMAAVLGALNAIGYAIGGGDEDKDRKLLPEEKAGKIFGFMGPKLIRMPWNDEHDSPVFLDIRRFVPAGDIFDMGQTHSALPVLPAALPGGPLAVLAELIFNKSQFTGKGITQETDTPLEMAGAVLNHIYKAFTPNVLGLPGTYATAGVSDAINGKTDAFGRERSVAQALLSSVGVKVGAYPHDTGLLNAQIDYQHQVGEIDKNIAGLRRQFATKAIDQAQFNAKLMAQVDKKMALAVKLRERVAP